jgi:hypothetical protein
MCCIFGVLGTLYLVGFGLLVGGLSDARRSRRAARWPTAPATITQLEIEEKLEGDSFHYEVKVQYHFVVDGVTYPSSRLAFGYPGYTTKTEHDQIYRKLKAAKAVTARYNPSDPSESCLSCGFHRSIIETLALSVTMLLVLVGVTLFFWLGFNSDRVLLNNLAVE